MDTCILDVSQLNDAQINSLKNFLPEKLQAIFNEYIQYQNIIAVEAKDGHATIGFALATYDDTLSYSELHLIYAGQDNKSVYFSLLMELEKELRNRNVQSIFHVYDDNEDGHLLQEAMLDLKWGEPKLYTFKGYIDQSNFDPEWMRVERAYPRGFEDFPWKELKPEEKQRLQHMQNSVFFPQSLSPFVSEETIEHGNSLGLRHKGAVVGWMVTHRIDSDTIRYSTFYLDQDLQMSGVAIQLLSHSLRLHKASGVRWGIFESNIIETEPNWVRFLRKHLIPLASKVYYRMHIAKALS